MKHVAVLSLIVLVSGPVYADAPQCSSGDNWAASEALVLMKAAGLIDGDKVDGSKTEAVTLATQLIGTDLYRQVHRVKFVERSGHVIEVIIVNDASHDKCSVGYVDIFVVARHIAT